MLLAIDVGNTNIVWGVYDGDALRHHWRTNTDRAATGDELAILARNLMALAGLELRALDGVVIGSVVPPLRAPLRELCVHYLGCEPLFVGPETTGGLRLDVEDPARVGADRIANAVAAWEKYRRALIVVDFGTATNFDVVSAEGAFIGGAIAPGVIISTEALFQRAAALARIELVRPATAIGKNTITNVQAGILFGAAGQVDGLVERIRAELGEPEAPAIATGGLASLIARESRTVTDVDPFLTLDGLRLIYQRSRRS